MEKDHERTWKIGELARVFDVNVQLLRHYDKEGLLVPDSRDPDNKRRGYRYDQIYTLGMIRLLRFLDCSLDEIGDFMKRRTTEFSERFLRERFRKAKKKYEKLLRMEAVFDERFALIHRDMPYAEADQVFIWAETDIYYIETEGLEKILADELLYIYPAILFYRNEDRRFAVRIPPEDAAGYGDMVHMIPCGDYLTGFHRGSYENIRDTFERVRQAADGILDEGDRLSDDFITMNIVDQLVEEDRERFITRVMIKIIH